MISPPIDVSVILPAWEEAANLEWLLPRLRQTLESLGGTWEIIVADAMEPRDVSPEICARNAVTYLPRQGGVHYGFAVRSGIAASRGRYVIFMDSDGSHAPEFVSRLWPFREQGGIVIASRYVKGGHTENPRVLIWMSQLVNLTFRVFLGLDCADVSNSYRLYQGDELRALHLECEHFDIVEEILVKIKFSRPGYPLLEIPFTFEKRKEGQTKRRLVSFAFGYAATILRLLKLKAAVKRAQKNS